MEPNSIFSAMAGMLYYFNPHCNIGLGYSMELKRESVGNKQVILRAPGMGAIIGFISFADGKYFASKEGKSGTKNAVGRPVYSCSC